MVEHDLAKVGVASSNLVSRSKFLYSYSIAASDVESMRPLYAPATECRPSLHKALKLVFATNHNLLFH
ncbi:hypothetical protein ALT785_60123 [Alteromonas infernus]